MAVNFLGSINPFVSDVNIVLAFIAALLGFPGGIIVAHLAKEEMEDARKYLLLMMHFLIVLTILLFLFGRLHYVLVFIFSLAALFISTLIYTLISSRIKFILWYIILAVIYFLSARNIFLLVINESIIFLFGLATGSLFAEEYIFNKKAKKQKKKKKK